MDPRDHCDTVVLSGTKDITVAVLGPMIPRAQCEAAGLCGTKRPLLHYRALCSQRAVEKLQGTVDPWRALWHCKAPWNHGDHGDTAGYHGTKGPL